MQKPLRILQVLNDMDRGGAETMIMNYYRNIDRDKIQFDFLLHREEKGDFDDEITSLGGNIYRIQSINLLKISKYLKELDQFFNTHNEYKVVHSHINTKSVFVLKGAKKNNVPIRIAHSHTSLYSLNLNPFSKSRHSLNFVAKFIIQNILKLKITKYANYYFSCGDKAGKWLFGAKNIHKVKLIYNAIDSSDFIYSKDKSFKFREKLEVQDKIVIGHVGNLVPEKNHSFIVKTYKEIRKLNPNTSLILVGAFSKTDLEKTIGEEVPDDIKVLGLRKDVPDLLSAMDIFLFPSTNEGLPLSLIEAQASGLKIKASANITRELNITSLIDYISLKKPHEYWAKNILQSLPYERRNTKKEIVEGGYDIENNALSLQEFYFSKLKNNQN